MGFQVGNFSLLATKSMHSVDSWLSTIQANINGSTRNSFKQSEITYGGNITYQLKNNRPEKAGEQIAEQVLTTGHTRVDWSQGSIVSSTQDTHFAIQGEGFFLVADYPQRSDYVGHTTTNLDDLYLTRDGEFHWAIIPGISANDPVLVTNQGHIVMGEGNGLTTSNNHSIRILYSEFTNGTHKPAVVLPDFSGPSLGAGTQVVPNDDLQYSSTYGSTYYVAPTAASFKTIINGNDGVFDRRDIGGPVGNSVMLQSQLEASNTKVEKNIVEMSVLGKVYNGFVQVIKMYNANIDEMLNFIR